MMLRGSSPLWATLYLLTSTHDAASHDLVLGADHTRHGFCIKAMLFDENSRRQSLHRIIIVNGNDALLDDRTTIERLVNEVNGAARPLDAVFERLALRVETWKCRQQARMNVENAPAISFYKIAGEKAHVTGETDQINLTSLHEGDDLTLMLFTHPPAPLDCDRHDPALSGARKSSRPPLITHHNCDLRVRNTTLINGVGERQHVRAAPGNQDAYPTNRHKSKVWILESKVWSLESDG